MTRYTRKDFLKILGLGVGAGITATLNPAFAAIDNEVSLATEQKAFLEEYAQWLTEFQYFVTKRNENSLDPENNKKLMALSAEAEVRKPKLELFMQDQTFAETFNKITSDITAAI